MIFVTVGTHTQSFNRLLEEMDKLVGNDKIKEDVIAQIGYSTYEPKNFEWFRFDTFKRLNKCYKSRIVITHGGGGSILNGLINSKVVIAVPRLKKYGEHTNDHQVDLVKKLESNKKIIAVYDIKDLYKTISNANKMKLIPIDSGKMLEKAIERIEMFMKENIKEA